MENNNDILELLDILYGMVNEAWSVPLGQDKCIIEREKALDIINDIKANLPTSIAESKRLVSARDEFIGNAKREAEALRKNAVEESERLINEQEVLKTAQARADELISNAENKTAELKRVASEYINKIMDDAVANLSQALDVVKGTESAFKTSSDSLSKLGQNTELNNTAEDEKKNSADEEPRLKRRPVIQTQERRKVNVPRLPLKDPEDESNWETR